MFRANKEDLEKLLETRRMSDSESGIHRVMMHRNPRLRSNSDNNIYVSSEERREGGQEFVMSSSSIDERELNRLEQRNNRSHNEENFQIQGENRHIQTTQENHSPDLSQSIVGESEAQEDSNQGKNETEYTRDFMKRRDEAQKRQIESLTERVIQLEEEKKLELEEAYSHFYDAEKAWRDSTKRCNDLEEENSRNEIERRKTVSQVKQECQYYREEILRLEAIIKMIKNEMTQLRVKSSKDREELVDTINELRLRNRELQNKAESQREVRDSLIEENRGNREDNSFTARRKSFDMYHYDDSHEENQRRSASRKRSPLNWRENSPELHRRDDRYRKKYKTKPPSFETGAIPRIFILRFDEWVNMEQETDYGAALSFKNAMKDDVILLGLTRLPRTTQSSYKKLRRYFLDTYDKGSNEFYKKTLTEVLKQEAGETVWKYYRRLYENADLDEEEKNMVTDFVKGLQPKIKLQILSSQKEPQNMSEALQIASRWEQLLQDQGTLEAKSAVSSNYGF